MFEISVFMGIQARIWSPNGVKLRSAHLAGRAENVVNIDVLVKSHFLCKIAPKSSPKKSQDNLWAPFWAPVGDFLAHLGPLISHMGVYYAFCVILCARGSPQERPRNESAAEAETPLA